MNIEERRYRALNFDLKLKLLRQHYPNKNILTAYKDIKRFMLKNDFSHRQWSGYRSNERLTDRQAYNLMLKMREELPWIDKCSTRIDLTNIEKVYDIKALFVIHDADERFNNMENMLQKAEIIENKPIPLKERMENAKREALEYNMNRSNSMEKDFSKDLVL